MILEWVYKPNPVTRSRCETRTIKRRAIIANASDGHSSRRRITPLAQATYPEVVAPNGCFGRAALADASLFGLAPRRVCLAAEVSPPALVGSYIKLRLKPHRFTHHLCSEVHGLSRDLLSHRLVYSLLHLSSGRPAWPLASPLPCGVRTFLSRI